MGRSAEHKSKNPAQAFLKWKGGDGKLVYWDGEADVEVGFSEKKPFKFLVVEKGAQVTGGVTLKGGDYIGYFSNFVLDTRSEPFTVRSKEGIVAQGLWQDIKKENDALKFATSLYIGVPTGDGLSLQHLTLSGAALNAWIEATKRIDVFKGAFAIVGSSKEKNGAVTYHVPVFKYYPEVSEEADEQAKALDASLQEYLKGYFTNGHSSNGHVEEEPEYSGKAMAATADPLGDFSERDLQPAEPDDTDSEIPF